MSGQAVASSTFGFAVSTDDLVITPGGTGSIDVFINETFDDTSIITDDAGLFSAAFDATRLTGDAEFADAEGDPAFDDFLGPTIILSATDLAVVNFTDLLATTGPTGTEIEPGVQQVRVGSITFTGLNEGVSTFSIFENAAFDDQITLMSGLVLDPLFTLPPTTVTVTVVPTPGALAIASCAGMVLARRRRA